MLHVTGATRWQRGNVVSGEIMVRRESKCDIYHLLEGRGAHVIWVEACRADTQVDEEQPTGGKKTPPSSLILRRGATALHAERTAALVLSPPASVI